MGVKTIVEDSSLWPERVRGLQTEGYNRFRIFLHGSREHGAKGLEAGKALIRCWRE